MNINRSLAVCAIGLLLPACGPWQNPANQPTTQVTPPKAGSDVSGALPSDIAAGPETINIPRRFQQSLSLKALASGGDVTIYSGSPWKGRQVTVYYIPNNNIVFDGHQYYLRSTANLQRVGQSAVKADGTWTVVWHIGHEAAVPKRELFLLARSNDGEIAMCQVQHFQNHKW